MWQPNYWDCYGSWFNIKKETKNLPCLYTEFNELKWFSRTLMILVKSWLQSKQGGAAAWRTTRRACEVVKMACEKIGSKVQDENCLLHFNKYSRALFLFQCIMRYDIHTKNQEQQLIIIMIAWSSSMLECIVRDFCATLVSTSIIFFCFSTKSGTLLSQQQ